MTDTNHPITPPRELVEQWATEYWIKPGGSTPESERYLATQSADWQLEQVKEAVSAKIADLRQFPGWREDADILEFYFDAILKELRPQETRND